MTPPDRSCIGCKNWWFDSGAPYYSEMTPGENWSAECMKRDPDGKSRWRLSGYRVEDGDWFRAMQTAKDCPDYDPRPGAPA